MTETKETVVEIENVEVSAFSIPTDSPESDGTLSWDKTILVLVEITAGNKKGIGFTYADLSTAKLIKETLSKEVIGADVMNIPLVWEKMATTLRNIGLPGIGSMAISAIDIALYDLKTKILNISLANFLGTIKESIPLYGSGGFTNYNDHRLIKQLERYVDEGFKMVKIKIGISPKEDLERVKVVRKTIGNDIDLFVDANGAYSRKQALTVAQELARLNVSWFEEPVSSDDLESLRFLSQKADTPVNIAAGEYGYDLFYFHKMLMSNAVDVLQIDVGRCGGITAFLKIAALAEAFHIPISTHTIPSIHLHLACCTKNCLHVEYFYDHVRIEKIFFENSLVPKNGELYPRFDEPGLGLSLKHKDVEKFKVN